MITAAILCHSAVVLAALNKDLGPGKTMFVVLVLAWGALFGAHLGHRLLFLEFYQARHIPLMILCNQGHTLLGAAAFDAGLLWALSGTVPGVGFWTTADAFALGTPLGLFFARLGCHLKGCCWGTPLTEGHPLQGLAFKLINNQLVALHPVQLYSAYVSLAVFCLLLALKKRQTTPGTRALTLVLLYSASRFMLEFFRGDISGQGPLPGFLSLHQGLCLVMFPGAACLLFQKLRRTRKQR